MPSEAADFAGLRVASFESRRAEEMARFIEKAGGIPAVSPSMREVPLEKNVAAVDFANRVMTGQVDLIVFMTGVGLKMLIQQVERYVDLKRFLESVSDVVTLVRGPKPVAVLKELGLAPRLRAPEPNTWREVLQTLDAHGGVTNQNVAVLEYGEPNASLVAGLEARGARVLSVKIYAWELPLDTRPLEANIRAICAGERDVAMFTSQHQTLNLLEIARKLGLEESLRAAFDQMVVASIGPTTSEGLRDQGFTVDVEPEHSKMGQLVQAAAERSGPILRMKRPRRPPEIRATEPARAAGSAPPTANAPWHNSLFLKACRREPTERTPIWLMRQAGRYLPEYRAIREKTTFLEFCKNPRLSAEVMLATVQRLEVDAAIIFSDLLPILEPMGLQLEFTAGEGPQIHNPLRERADLARFHELDDLAPLGFVMETVRLTRAGLPDTIPVIGFAGAPFTLASYAIEGGASRNYVHTKSLMYRDPGVWLELMGRLARGVTRYLNGQIAAGAQAVQLFDSWAGALGADDYRRYVLPFTKQIIDHLTPGTPVINFATGNAALLPLLAEAGGHVIGVDWRIELTDAWQRIGYDRAVQGNLDPVVLFAEPREIRRRAEAILSQVAGRPGHIFNLGHGVLPHTPVENVLTLIETVKDFRTRS
ncbi:MAG TPA: uroporphyrinogen decarboxylase [Pirellulales bacterium]|jgi:uroporphyrinogen decarboxylase|nr:uroporphyrinogen decarboxylase [Pirellulales bacterium]